ncbi:MAG: biotin/lipoyl-binding protein [Phycisphaera sp.]|nr:biotin/lipoyl-binding protein [Phycisphaera sp.]
MMHRTNHRLFAAVLTLALLVCTAGPSLFADDAKPDAGANDDAGKKWLRVEPGAFNVQLTLDGVIEAERAWPVQVKLDEWQSLVIATPVRSGQHVKKGQTLFELETEDIDKAIADAEISAKPARLALQQAQLELAQMEVDTPRKLEDAEQKYTRAVEDIDRYLKVGYGLAVKENEENFASARNALEYTTEELNQLQAMYKEDDLTEQTEEIILKRQKRAVEVAKFRLEQAASAYEVAAKHTLPRALSDAKRNRDKWDSFITNERKNLPLALQLKRETVAKMEHDRTEAEAKLVRLKADRKKMAITSPADGVVYLGAQFRGRWSNAGYAAAMQPGGTFKNGTIICTIVQPRPAFIRVDAGEGDLYGLRPGVSGVARCNAFPQVAIPARVRSVDNVPIDNGKYDVVIELPDVPEGVMPGMTFKLTLTPYRNDKALTLPLSAVEDAAPGGPYVMVRGEGDRAVKRPVKLGWRANGRVEVLDGLKAGDEVSPKP